ncbi:TAXI family TRAP transporter solute-binding subunit [Pararhizobium mangrovi]|uniref:TAXI family TRAP transporter solute-binding subunit n=1 Tax=Pararhizobium mangrovi TaxID=2590452 RepID=A0A506U874_9HYPH|nr:TAXI family TRAP transporter solute-binding subunit [Pararhizobium mangrovi]TPW30622.1 TAXI family TRAP transporter solute-binding subunit [Pararhizobium mangrovi]
MRTFRKVVLAFAALGALASAPGVSSAEELRIGTASLGGAFYPMGQAISNLVNEHAKGITMVPVVTQGAVQNPRLVDSGEADFAIANASTAFFAARGEQPYQKKLDVVAVGPLHPSILHIVTLQGSSIQSISDLKGKRVAVGPAGGGTLSVLRDLFSVYDMSLKDVTPSFLSYSDGFSQLADGNVDASIALAGFPTSAVTQTQATNKIAFVSIPQDKFAEIEKKFPYYTDVDVAADIYKTQGDVKALGVSNILITSSKMDDAKVSAVTKAIYDHLDEFAKENANAKQVDPAMAAKIAVPLHPAAKAYFEAK